MHPVCIIRQISSDSRPISIDLYSICVDGSQVMMFAHEWIPTEHLPVENWRFDLRLGYYANFQPQWNLWTKLIAVIQPPIVEQAFLWWLPSTISLCPLVLRDKDEKKWTGPLNMHIYIIHIKKNFLFGWTWNIAGTKMQSTIFLIYDDRFQEISYKLNNNLVHPTSEGVPKMDFLLSEFETCGVNNICWREARIRILKREIVLPRRDMLVISK